MKLEQALEKITSVRQNFVKLRDDKNKLFSGIKTLDRKLLGFDFTKKYLIAGQKGMGIETFYKTIQENINALYGNTNLSFLEFQYIDKSGYSPITLADVNKNTEGKFDVILSVFRPEYYKIETWEDGASTQNQIEFYVIKNYKNHMPKGRLQLDIEKRRVLSISKSVFGNFYGRIQEILNKPDINTNS